jgi:hypothetical protein
LEDNSEYSLKDDSEDNLEDGLKVDIDIGCCYGTMECLLCSTLPPTLTAGRTGQALIEPHIVR